MVISRKIEDFRTFDLLRVNAPTGETRCYIRRFLVAGAFHNS
jgi:hypothetical protein